MRTGEVTTNDGVRLHYVEAGTGPDLLLVSGWTLTAELWRYQIEEFSRTHHVVAYDHRGHGQSDHPPYGYRMARLAVDAHEVIEALGLSDITLVAHSMGCGVAFAYWDLYRDERLKRLVLIDEPPALSSQPDWPEGMAAQVGAPHTAEGLPTFTAALTDQGDPGAPNRSGASRPVQGLNQFAVNMSAIQLWPSVMSHDPAGQAWVRWRGRATRALSGRVRRIPVRQAARA